MSSTKAQVEELLNSPDRGDSCLFCKHYGCPMLVEWRKYIGHKADTSFSCSQFREAIYKALEGKE